MRGIRGAITVEKDTKDEIFQAVKLMVMGMCRTNKIDPADIGAAIFSATPDLKSAFPAPACRKAALHRTLSRISHPQPETPT